MNNQIFSLAIALPSILLATLPSLANPVQVNSLKKIDGVQTSVVTSGQQLPSGISNPSDAFTPGPGGVAPNRPRGPRPPRRDDIINVPGRFSQPVLNNNITPTGINQVVVGQ